MKLPSKSLTLDGLEIVVKGPNVRGVFVIEARQVSVLKVEQMEHGILLDVKLKL